MKRMWVGLTKQRITLYVLTNDNKTLFVLPYALPQCYLLGYLFMLLSHNYNSHVHGPSYSPYRASPYSHYMAYLSAAWQLFKT